MNKYLSLLCLLVYLVSGCSQEELLNIESSSSDGRKYTASFEQHVSRTYIEDGNLLRWTAGDEISLFDGSTLNSQFQFDGETGDNAGTFTKISDPSYGTGNSLSANYALYPYASGTKIKENGVLTVTLPATQTYATNSFGLGANTMVAVTKNVSDKFLPFKNVGGYLKLQLYGDNVTVKSITLTGNNNEKLAGKATVTPVYGNEPTTSMADDATESITLNCGENGVKIGSTSATATAFWLVVPPTTFEKGFTVTITDINDYAVTKSASKETTIERNVIKPMSAFEVRVTIPNNQIWYTSIDGKVLSPYDYDTSAFGVAIMSNTYNNGKGVITFDGDVTRIEPSAFKECESLKSITLPNSVTTIGSEAFMDCEELVEVNIPNGVTSIEDRTFYGCISLSNIVIPNTITTIGERAFYRCVEINNIILPNSLQSISDYAFYDCGINEIIIPNSVTSIGTGAFFYSSLKEVTIPNNILYIPDYAFYKCISLSKVNIPYGIKKIGSHAFYGCNKLINVTLPNSVTFIGEGAFWDCTSISYINIPNSVQTIDATAFCGCSKLQTISIPNSVTTIGKQAFSGCILLDDVIIPNNVTVIEEQLFNGCKSLSDVLIPDGVVEIKKSAFEGCTSLPTVTIPNSVQTIGASAFIKCDALKEFHIEAITPPNVYGISFYNYNQYGTCKIYVPFGCLDKYKNADIWKEFTNIIEE